LHQGLQELELGGHLFTMLTFLSGLSGSNQSLLVHLLLDFHFIIRSLVDRMGILVWLS